MSTSPPDTPGSTSTLPSLERDSDDDETWTVQRRPKIYGGHGQHLSISSSSSGDCISAMSDQHPHLHGRRGPRSHGDREGEGKKITDLYKTEMCHSVAAGTTCRYGDQCQFAHSEHELNQVARHPRYKTQFCTSFQSFGRCKYNDRCTFIHHPDEARTPTMNRRANALIRAKTAMKTAGVATTTSVANTDHHRKGSSDSTGLRGSLLEPTWIDATTTTALTNTTTTTVTTTATTTAAELSRTCGSVCASLTPAAELNHPPSSSPASRVRTGQSRTVQSYAAMVEKSCGGTFESLVAQVTLYHQAAAPCQASTCEDPTATAVVVSTSDMPVSLSWDSSGLVSGTTLPSVNPTMQTATVRHPSDMADVQSSSQMKPDAFYLVEDEPPTWLASLGHYIWTPQNEFEL
ncbi:hypothetical protein DFQ26_009032 [Actinomortierella ambigua]|nr:hypothetical protein DFQ26_009032 [Actinomortierella ambigua]